MLNTLAGTLVNTGTILLGSVIGLLFKKGIPEKVSKAVMIALGLCTVMIGITGITSDCDVIVTILAMVIGTAIGTLIGLDKLLNRFGNFTQRKTSELGAKIRNKKQVKTVSDAASLDKENKETHSTVGEALVTSSLLFCVGAMTIVGSLNAGLTGNNTMLFAKSVLDFTSSIVFASTLGYGVCFSSVVVLVLQGGIALLAKFAEPLLSGAVVNEMTCVGSLLIIALGLNMIKVTKIKVMDMIPAVFLPILFIPLENLIKGLF